MSTITAMVFISALVGILRPYIRSVKRWQFGLAAFAALFIAGAAAQRTHTIAKQNPGAAGIAPLLDPAPVPNATAPRAEPTTPTQWIYEKRKDELRNSEDNFAQINSEETIKLDFPYGEQTGHLLLRNSKKSGLNILVGVHSGQILCNRFQNSHISVKFDDGPIRKFACVDASDESSNMVFVQNPKSFLAQLRHAKQIVIEAEFFQNGLQQMKFKTANLAWD